MVKLNVLMEMFIKTFFKFSTPETLTTRSDIAYEWHKSVPCNNRTEILIILDFLVHLNAFTYAIIIDLVFHKW